MPKQTHQWKCSDNAMCLSHEHTCNLCNRVEQAGRMTLWNMHEGYCKGATVEEVTNELVAVSHTDKNVDEKLSSMEF